MLENFKLYNKELEYFILYFIENWLNYFKDRTLNLKNITLVTFIDMLKNLILSQMEILIDESKINLKPLSKTRIKGLNEYFFDNNAIKNLDDICNEIVLFTTESLLYISNKNLKISEKTENNLEISNNITFNPLASPGEGVTVFTYPYLSAGAPTQGEAKGLIKKHRMKIILITKILN